MLLQMEQVRFRQHGQMRQIQQMVLPVDIHQSQAKCTVEDGNIRLGLQIVKRMGEAATQQLLTARENAPFTSLVDFCRRTYFPHALVENLIIAGGMDG